MNYRKLRIAWSVAWGVVALLLVVSWARSYWHSDWILYEGRSTRGIIAVRGVVSFVRERDGGSGRWGIGSKAPRPTDVRVDRLPVLDWNTPAVRHWLPVLVCCAFGALSWPLRSIRHSLVVLVRGAFGALRYWLPIRFSLRTLLIATTLVALLLGLFVWLR